MHALALLETGDLDRGRRLASEGTRDTTGAPLQPTFQHWIFDRGFTRVRRALGASAYDEAMARGRRMTPEEAIRLAAEPPPSVRDRKGLRTRRTRRVPS